MNKISLFLPWDFLEMTWSYLRFRDFSVFLTYFRDKIELEIEKISFIGEIPTQVTRVPCARATSGPRIPPSTEMFEKKISTINLFLPFCLIYFKFAFFIEILIWANWNLNNIVSNEFLTRSIQTPIIYYFLVSNELAQW